MFCVCVGTILIMKNKNCTNIPAFYFTLRALAVYFYKKMLSNTM